VQFGAKGHYYVSFSPTLIFGLGGFVQQSNLKDVNDPRRSLGVDVAGIFVLQDKPEISPYIRFIYSFYDKVGSVSGNGFGLGGGVKYDYKPSVRLFAELMYESATYKHKESYNLWGYSYTVNVKYEITMLSINVGATYLFDF
jgi:hypothetical protein